MYSFKVRPYLTLFSSLNSKLLNVIILKSDIFQFWSLRGGHQGHRPRGGRLHRAAPGGGAQPHQRGHLLRRLPQVLQDIHKVTLFQWHSPLSINTHEHKVTVSIDDVFSPDTWLATLDAQSVISPCAAPTARSDPNTRPSSVGCLKTRGLISHLGEYWQLLSAIFNGMPDIFPSQEWRGGLRAVEHTLRCHHDPQAAAYEGAETRGLENLQTAPVLTRRVEENASLGGKPGGKSQDHPGKIETAQV